MTQTNTDCPVPKCQISCTFHCLWCWKGSVKVWDYIPFCNMLSFYSDELLALHPPKLEDNPLSAVYLFTATLHMWRLSPPSTTWGRHLQWWAHLSWYVTWL